MATTDSFTYFSRLPPELQNMIWELALPCHRYIKVTGIYRHAEQTSPGGNPRSSRGPFQSRITIRNPSLLAVCKESRAIAEHVYRPQLKIHRKGKPVRLNFDTDVIFIEDAKALKAFCTFDGMVTNHFAAEDELLRFKSNVRHLMLGGPLWHEQALDFVCDLENLETLDVEQLFSSDRLPGISANFRAMIISVLETAWSHKRGDGAAIPKVNFKSWEEISRIGALM
ncbi:hypothetical protein EG329_005742 [Mollisiaceae sp. DMI_Dod_QoI]|nr:hypothetical protein EG329_005742 [Helotiales sp. DMI_Dod_QoI]